MAVDERSRLVDRHEPGRAASGQHDLARRRERHAGLPRNGRVEPNRLRADEILVESEGMQMRTFRVLVLAALAAGSLAVLAPGASASRSGRVDETLQSF